MRGTHRSLRTDRVHFGPGSLDELATEAGEYERVFIVTGRTLDEETDLVRRVEELLADKHAGTFAAMGEHTPGSAVERVAEEARGCGLLVSVGGGSVIDGTKAAAARLGYPAHVAVPTTLSGAEWAERVGVTDEAAGKKSGFIDERAVPPVVILDPEATRFTPEKLWLSTGIRALDHAVEGFIWGGPHPVTDVTGLEGARRLVEHLPLSKMRPGDEEIRLELQLAAWLAYFAPLNTPMGLSHGLGRRIGASYSVPHGYTSCITLAPTVSVAKRGMPEDRWETLGEALGGEPDERIAALIEELGLPSTLSDVGVPERDIDPIAAEFGDSSGEAREVLHQAL
ncbi:iron-containing alcohol dehydrogenase [Rubrobacter aplysinae]|uniref:iron-containing alcohol dehydrogenase n=1 Tax=Rubrobacter aplysinae TaxID=909625 RepID=UPI00064C16A7|nr:iron-containing alcohol dehydrogenase [Rubrobacter aplysinae]